MLLSDIVARGARDYPTHPALIFRDQPISYGELAVITRRLAAGLADLGVRQGDRVALLLPNCPPFVYGYYAVGMLGATVVPANPLLKPAELQYIYRDATVKLVITAGPLLPGVEAARAELPELRHVVSITPPDELSDPALA